MTADDYRIARETYAKAVGAQPLAALLRTAALTVEEARQALIRAGDNDDELAAELFATGAKLLAKGKATQLSDHLRK